MTKGVTMKKVLELLPTAEPKSDLNKPKKPKKPKSQVVKRETANPNIAINLRSKCRTNFKLVYEPLKAYKGTEEYLRDVADELKYWALTDPNALDLTQFLIAHEIPKTTFFDWKNRSPYLKETLELVKNKLAWNRELALAEGYLHPSTVIATRHLYDEQYSSEEDRRATLIAKAKAEATKPADVNIYMQDLVAQDEEVQ